MVRALYLIENGSDRSDHRARREVCTPREAGGKSAVARSANKDNNLLQINEERFPGWFEWGNCSKSA